MGVLLQQKFFVVVNFFFLLESWALLLRRMIVDVSDIVAFGGFSLVVTFASHWLLGVLSNEWSFHCASSLPEVGLHWFHLRVNLLWVHSLVKGPIRTTETLVLLRHKVFRNIVIFRVFTIFLSVKLWFLDV